MAGVVLKDGNGIEVEHGNPSQIEVPYKENDGNTSKVKYTLMSRINVYTYIGADDPECVKITGRVSKLAAGDFFISSFGEKQLKELGSLVETKYDGVVVDSEYKINILFTLKSFTVGEVYSFEEILS